MACALRSLGQKSVTLIFDRLGGEGGACSVLMVLFTFYANLGLSNPLCSGMPLFFGGAFLLARCVLGVPLFSSEDFFIALAF
jgi:hypothetical protein